MIGTGDNRSYDDEMGYLLDIPNHPDIEPRNLSQIKQSPNYDPKTDVYQQQGQFDTPLNPEEQESYNKKYGPSDNRDYDMQGFHKYNPDFEAGPGQHYPDTFKKPNHPTFSDESIYHGGEYEGGRWNELEGGRYGFTPGRTNIKEHGEKSLQDYFKRNEPGNVLNPAPLTEPKDIHIVRHGETTENADNTVRGWEPVSLNDKGREEAEKAADELKSKGVDTIVSSDLQRAKETSEIIGKKLGIEPQYDPRLRTWNVGEHAGKPCKTSNPVLKKFVQDTPDKQVPGGESFNEFTDRSFAGIRDAILNNKDKQLAIVTHNRVEATLKGWEKTGQDNPDIDVNEAVKEETEPGTVRPFTMQPNSSIMKDDVNVYKNLNEAIQAYLMNRRSKEFERRFKGLSDFGRERRNTFEQRFQGQDKLPIEGIGFDPRKMPDWWTRQTGTTPFPEDLKNLPLTEQTGPLPDPGGAVSPRFTPVSSKNINPTMKAMRDALVEHIRGLGEKAVESLHDILLHPENLPSTGELAGTVFKGSAITDIVGKIQEGKSLKDIAKEMGVGLYQLKDMLGKKRILPKSGQDDVPDWFKEEMEQTLEKELKIQNPSQQQQGKPPSKPPIKWGPTEKQPLSPLEHSKLMQRKGLEEALKKNDPEQKAKIKWTELNPDVRDTKLREVLEKNPDLRQVPWGWTKEQVQKLSIDDYFKGLAEGFGEPPK